MKKQLLIIMATMAISLSFSQTDEQLDTSSNFPLYPNSNLVSLYSFVAFFKSVNAFFPLVAAFTHSHILSPWNVSKVIPTQRN
jgi:hypothetical protein